MERVPALPSAVPKPRLHPSSIVSSLAMLLHGTSVRNGDPVVAIRMSPEITPYLTLVLVM